MTVTLNFHRIVDYANKGLSYRQIAVKMKHDHSTIRKHVEAYSQELHDLIKVNGLKRQYEQNYGNPIKE